MRHSNYDFYSQNPESVWEMPETETPTENFNETEDDNDTFWAEYGVYQIDSIDELQ